MGEIMEGMSLNDLHAAVYLSTGNEICRTVQGGETLEVPLYLSSMTGENFGEKVIISYELSISNVIGENSKVFEGTEIAAYKPWIQDVLDPLSILIPDVAGVATLKLKLRDESGNVLHRNFMHFEVLSDQKLAGTEVLSTPAVEFLRSQWSQRQWNVLDGKKVNGCGEGFFEYTIAIPRELKSRRFKKGYFLVEVSAKELFVKDQAEYNNSQDFMLGSKENPSANPNSYPMTDETLFPSEVSFVIGGKEVYSTTLADDPADHRGVLSWHHQLKDKRLREAGSYGYLVKVPIKKGILKSAIEAGSLKVKIQTKGEGGIAVYGKEFGRYALDPSLVLQE